MGSRSEELMKIVPIPHNLELGVSTLPRSPGLHMSQIYGDLYQDLEPKRFVRGGTPDINKMEAGLGLESVLEEGLKGRLAERPGEFVTDEGIIYSPDLIIFNDVTRLGEIKLTWLSCREVPREPGNSLPQKMDKWLTQMKAYCYHLQTPYARLYAFFVNGTYKHPYTPELLAWDIEFSTQELKENWQMLMNHARHKGMLS